MKRNRLAAPHQFNGQTEAGDASPDNTDGFTSQRFNHCHSS
jgi:hypothetical protein